MNIIPLYSEHKKNYFLFFLFQKPVNLVKCILKKKYSRSVCQMQLHVYLLKSNLSRENMNKLTVMLLFSNILINSHI